MEPLGYHYPRIEWTRELWQWRSTPRPETSKSRTYTLDTLKCLILNSFWGRKSILPLYRGYNQCTASPGDRSEGRMCHSSSKTSRQKVISLFCFIFAFFKIYSEELRFTEKFVKVTEFWSCLDGFLNIAFEYVIIKNL